MELPWQLQQAKYLLFVSLPFCAHFRSQIYSTKELIAVVIHGVAWVGGGGGFTSRVCFESKQDVSHAFRFWKRKKIFNRLSSLPMRTNKKGHIFFIVFRITIFLFHFHFSPFRFYAKKRPRFRFDIQIFT